MLRFALAAFVAVLFAGGPARSQVCSGGFQYNLTNGNFADATQVMANFNFLLACVNGLSSAGERQTATSGPVAPTTGLPSFLPSTTVGLSITSSNVSGAAPLIVSAANNSDTGTGLLKNRVGITTSNLTWSGLAAGTTNFLYVTVAANGNLTTGSTTLEPIYQWGGVPPITNKQFTFNIGEMRGYLGDGSTAPQSYVVFVGEAVTSGTQVTGTAAYAYNGRYEGLFAGPLVAGPNWVGTGHNIGVKPTFYDFIVVNISQDWQYVVGDTLHAGSLVGDYSTFTLPLALTANRTAITYYAPAGNSPYVTTDKGGNTRITLDRAKWQYKFIARRGW
jgi:hypothetical protein